MKALLLSVFLFCSVATVSDSFSVTGVTVTHVLGKTEKLGNLTLNVAPSEDGNSVSLKGFEILGYKNISISGVVRRDARGNITSWSNVKIKGVPAKVTKLTGRLLPGNTDINMEGKAAGMFKFTIHYSAK